MQRESARAILYHARKANLASEHQAVLLTIAEIESGFNPMARASSSSACGLFQFIKATGKRYNLPREDCMNPMLNAKAGVQHYLDNFNGRVLDEVKALSGPEKLIKIFKLSYFMHHDGPKSDNPSDRLKAIVLEATPFLLRSHTILKQEEERLASQPTFYDNFVQRSNDRLTSVVDGGKSLLSNEQETNNPDEIPSTQEVSRPSSKK